MVQPKLLRVEEFSEDRKKALAELKENNPESYQRVMREYEYYLKKLEEEESKKNKSFKGGIDMANEELKHIRNEYKALIVEYREHAKQMVEIRNKKVALREKMTTLAKKK